MTVHSAADRGGDKRERILAAAERVFAKNGFFAARVSEIAKDAGVADGTIYLYFKSKDDLLISLFENRMKQVIAMLERVTAGKP
ncbi:MAG TPA: helix-turn-helix domain-containing protein, partial [Kofleriaceae bacterium]